MNIFHFNAVLQNHIYNGTVSQNASFQAGDWRMKRPKGGTLLKVFREVPKAQCSLYKMEVFSWGMAE